MQKLKHYIQLEKKNGYEIMNAYSAIHGPGIANYEQDCVVLNQKFISGEIESFNENDLIGVLYHEIGHLKYFKEYPMLFVNLST